MHELFQMIDVDGSGTIELDEFIRPLSRWVHEPSVGFGKFLSMLRRVRVACSNEFGGSHRASRL